jgi:MFS family permease
MADQTYYAAFAGWLSDYCTHRRPLFLAALLIQAVAIGLFTAGTSLGLWIAGAILAGVSSAIVWASSLSLVIDRTDKTKLGQYLGYTSVSLSVGIFLGPVTGGAIYDAGGPYAVWGVVFGLIGLDAMLRLLLIEVTPERSDRQLSSKNSYGPTTSSSMAGILDLLKSPRLICALWVTVAQGTILSSFDGSLTIHLRDVFGWQATESGLVYIAFVLPAFLCPVVGMFADRYGGRYLAAFGFATSVAVLICLRFVDHQSIGSKVLLCALLFLLGLLLGTSLPIFSAEVAHVVQEYEERHPGKLGERGVIAQAEGLWWAAYSIGAACGPLWGGLVQGQAGWKTVTWTLAVLCAVTVVPIVAYTDGPLLKSRREFNSTPNL